MARAAGYAGGLIEDVIMRLVDVLLAFPGFLLALAIAGTLGPGSTNVLLGLIAIWWVSYARVVRGMVLTLAMAALNFLGVGAQPPTPEWGAMLNDGRAFLFTAPRLMILPGLAISLLVIGFNLLGDSLRDVLDPRDYTTRLW